MARKKPEAKPEPSLGEKLAEVAHDVIDAVVGATAEASKGEATPSVPVSDEDPNGSIADHPKFDKFK